MYSDEPRASEHKAGRERRTLTMNLNVNNQPLIPAFSPYEGEKENRSLDWEHANDLDFRGLRVHGLLSQSGGLPFQACSGRETGRNLRL